MTSADQKPNKDKILTITLSKKRANNLRAPSLLVQIQTGLAFNSGWKITARHVDLVAVKPLIPTMLHSFSTYKEQPDQKAVLSCWSEGESPLPSEILLSWHTWKWCAFHTVERLGTHTDSIGVIVHCVQNNWQLPSGHPKITASEFSGPSVSARPLWTDRRFDFSNSVCLCDKNKLGECYFAKEFAIQMWCM